MADRKILDNGTLVTLGLVGVVAAVGAANKAGLYGSRNPTSVSKAKISKAVALAKREIERDMSMGVVPRDVGSFADLHDYVDANAYGGLTSGAYANLSSSDLVQFAGAVQDELDAWLRSRNHSARYIVATVHDGTDWGIFRASQRDMDAGDDMSHAEAVETAKSAAARQKGSHWYDFGTELAQTYTDKAGERSRGTELAQTYTDKAGDRFFSGKSREENRMAAEAFASGLRAQVFTSPAFKRFLRSHPGAFRVSMMGEEAYVDQDVLLAYGNKDANVYVNTRQDAYRDLLESVANAHGYEIFD